MIKASIVGGAGYTAGELIRILYHHPEVELSDIVSRSHANEPVYKVHKDFMAFPDLKFSKELTDAPDVLFICLGHNKAKEYLEKNPVGDLTNVIDLSQDFRHYDTRNFGNGNFVFGLPEKNRSEIQKAQYVANPGCFATAIMLALLPLAEQKLLGPAVHVHAITGSTGAGQAPTATTHFSWRANNVSAYKVFEHQHEKEIKETLDYSGPLHFVPIRGPFTRGIFATAYFKYDGSGEEIKTIYDQSYKNEPFSHSVQEAPDLKQVVNTNHAFVHVEKKKDHVFITSLIDNLLKGASGQAVQNMNLMFGLNETTGLQLKPSYF